MGEIAKLELDGKIIGGIFYTKSKIIGKDNKVIAMHSFGESAPASALFNEFGFTVEHITQLTHEVLKSSKPLSTSI